jgi:hypothetical protein
MKHSKWLILLCIVATVGLTGCPDDDDDVISPPSPPQAAEAAIEDVLDNVVDPLVDAIEAITDYLDTLGKSVTRATCPDTSGVCSPGSLSCAPTTLGWDFTFNGCGVIGTSPTITLDGGVEVTPTGPSSATMTLTNLSVNNSTDLNGEIILADECNSTWDVTGGNAYLFGSIEACAEAYPTSNSELIIEIEESGLWLVTFNFNGTSTCSAVVSLDFSPVATCTINLETNDASCTGIDL